MSAAERRTWAGRDEHRVAGDCPTIGIVVLNWNGLEDTLRCLRSLERIDYDAWRVVVVDNGSTDGSVDALRRMASGARIELIETGRNLGYAGGNNVGIRHALDSGADFVLVLNNDTTVAPSLLCELVSAARAHPKAGCFGPWIFQMTDPETIWFAGSQWSPSALAFTAPAKGRAVSEVRNDVVATEYVCGAALFFRAEVVERVGLLDERFFLVYEESDWCFRARRAGFGCMMVPSARVWHKVGSSFGSEESPLRTYFSTRNRLLWIEKNRPRSETFRALARALQRLAPRAGGAGASDASTLRSLYWKGVGCMREWSRKIRDPQEIAHRRGILDYVLRRFGDCPQAVRELTAAWGRERASNGAAPLPERHS